MAKQFERILYDRFKSEIGRQFFIYSLGLLPFGNNDIIPARQRCHSLQSRGVQGAAAPNQTSLLNAPGCFYLLNNALSVNIVFKCAFLAEQARLQVCDNTPEEVCRIIEEEEGDGDKDPVASEEV